MYIIRVFLTLVYMVMNRDTLCRGCTRSRVCAVGPLALGDEGVGVQVVHAGHLLMVLGVVFDMRKVEMLSVFSLFLG